LRVRLKSARLEKLVLSSGIGWCGNRLLATVG